MGTKSVPLKIGNIGVGALKFDETPTDLELRRTANGFNLMIPATIHLSWDDREQPQPILVNLRAIIFAHTLTGTKMEIGRVRDDSIYSGPTKEEGESADLSWINVVAGLCFIEKNRNGNPPSLDFAVQGELCYAVDVIQRTPPNVIIPQPFTCSVLSYPRKFRSTIGINYPSDVWNRVIQKAL